MTTAKMALAQDHEWGNQQTVLPLRTFNKAPDIRALVEKAAEVLAPVWPLETFIACNPLHGYESLDFEDALVLRQWQSPKAEPDSLLAVNRQMIKWCSGFFDEGQSRIAMPHRASGFYLAFLKLACFDKQLHQNNQTSKQFLRGLPESAEEAIKRCLLTLGVPAGQEECFFSRTFLALPGWGGFVKRHTEWRSVTASEKPVTLIDFLAVRLVLTCLLWPLAAKEQTHLQDNDAMKAFVSPLKANEAAYRQTLLSRLLPQVKTPAIKTGRKTAQWVFCIDVRSEPLRRAIEASEHYETVGFAGFFGMPVRVSEFETGKTKACCPVLLEPRFAIKETPIAANEKTLKRSQKGKSFIRRLRSLYTQLKHNISSPFALAECLGPWCGVSLAFKSLAPHLSQRAVQTMKHWFAPSLPTRVAYESSDADWQHGLSQHEQITYAETALRLMGLTSDFAKLIILCGHGSATENNPYASALDCGACGGNHGGFNAQLLAAILNQPRVRWGLEERGIHLPLDTLVYAALHNTTTDAVEIHHQDAPAPIYPALLKQLQDDLRAAQFKTNQERGLTLGSKNPHQDVIRRSVDWSETRPEWGLARNAAFIAAPRQLTKNIPLDGRCFLHSYHWQEDDKGTLLETILTAPMVVAEWINTQYLFSTLDNVAFGSGSKITHNVVGRVGVMQGNGSDLMHGLPLQSVMSSDEQPYHQPQRLLTVVYAPRERVLSIIARHERLKNLFFNQWVHLLVIDPVNQLPYQLNPQGHWTLLSDTQTASCNQGEQQHAV
ncbi:DUF2309 domain-containing protein [Legionella taurinensis]|uniref:Probable inorganic carbon transporter subunit DabA n=1 Tax=Legionella taurinensis TaxID=70611 RepID=A0A3A5LI71_9GAMM|nr:DUF2309 domain-containing protein [Legionella taurinensis]MDX1836206.1 DUF2309 domain-containing protein [Legionella taurinensis]PUT42032.1 DUF2309 domain-containing protein [Legionella taurinensis]PUT44819.1 DUF2309 domain-containing protein [Legionella taurinensis]PUT48140.1 DUF2309 domain-containing protein [Legionella taurinensis]PUT48954.1 DUF2309 domain-containing protein [Legionella taurinensis]